MELQLANEQVSFGSAVEYAEASGNDPVQVAVGSVSSTKASGLDYDVTTFVEPSGLQLALKRGLDVILSAVSLLILSPLLVFVAIAVKATSPGPVFFVQFRPGRGGAMFPMFKFRTMYAHLGDKSGLKQTVKNDQRITRIGAFLRRTSIDELPQLLNILFGHMSVIGPRPHPAKMLAGGMDYEKLVPYYRMRLAMRPGLSGWAQANGLRGPTDDAAIATARINHDLAYIQNFSLLLDAKIIWTTVHREFLGGSGF